MESYYNDGWASNTQLNRDVFNGFWNQTHDRLIHVAGSEREIFTGVYTSADWWNSNVAGTLNGTFEWTSQVAYSTPSSADCAYGWDSPQGNGSHSAYFYAGYNQSSPCAVGWQWIAGSEDYDQVQGYRIVNNQGGVCD